MTAATDDVCILLPTYNGARHLPAQLDSLLRQTHDRWHCLIRDDGSTDDTTAIVDAYCNRHPARFRRVADACGNLGVMGSLNVLARQAQAPYFALCDQDDVWKPEKLETCLRAMREVEAQGNVPALVVSDLVVVDAALNVIHLSFWTWTGNLRHAHDLGCLPVFNVYAGCTMLGNSSLLRCAFPVPPISPMHDYWLAMVARYGGRVAVVDDGLILYRQHGANQCGVAVVPLWRRAAARLLRIPQFFAEARRLRRMRLDMLALLPQRLGTLPQRKAHEEAIAAERGNPLTRLAYLRRRCISPAKAFVYWLG